MSLLRAVIGGISGIVATGPMTVAMVLMHRRLPLAERYPLPPREITMKVAGGLGVAHKMAPAERSAATLVAHFAYGAATGALFGLGARQRGPAGSATAGTLFGIAVWTASYLGLLPGAGILSAATEHPARRNALMIAAHVIWGATLGLLFEVFIGETKQASAPLSTSPAPHRDAR
jgi:uncharacterized membrane protein YagU involved in acid resistance